MATLHERNAALAEQLVDARAQAASGNPAVARRGKWRVDDLVTALFEANVRLVYRYTAPFGDNQDYQDAGKLGLLVAIQTWDPSRASLATWAWPQIKKAVLREVAEAEHRLKPHAFTARADILVAEASLTDELGRVPTHAEVAERAGVAESLATHVRLTEQAGKTQSLNKVIGEDGLELGDVAGPAAPSAEDVALGVDAEPTALSDLDPDEIARLTQDCSILELVVGLRHTGADDGPPADFHELVGLLGVSRETLRKTFHKFCAKVAERYQPA